MSGERLRRRHRDLKTRDVFGAPSATVADDRLARCGRRFEDYSELVFAVLHASGSDVEEAAEA